MALHAQQLIVNIAGTVKANFHPRTGFYEAADQFGIDVNPVGR
jgi:hypothetical protein